MGLHLDAGSVAALEARTEGWIAGLQMASIALRAISPCVIGEDVPGFIAGFSGTNRYILDYLLEEVWPASRQKYSNFFCTHRF